MQRVLITGAAGRIGSVLRAGLRGAYPALRLSDIAPLGAAEAGEELCPADLRDFAAVERTMAGVDAVVHLGGVPEEDAWEPIHEVNIVGCYHVFEAARRHGVKRVVFASSNHVIGYYRRARRIGPDAPPRPDGRYGVSKLFGEGLGRLYADKHGIGCVALRIGSFQPEPKNVRMLSTWISHRDTVQLVRRALDAPDVHFEVVYGVSANARAWWDNPGAARIGYEPRDDAEDFAGEILAQQSPEDEPETERLFHGGPFCAMEFTGDTSDIE
ncbi:MAG: NAD-dependent epimerase/dehydratase family protein [Kiloniellaceae bacterium]